MLVYRNGRSDWKVTEATCANPNLVCEVKERARVGSEVWYTLDVRLKKTAPCGYMKDHVLLTTNDPSMAQIPVAVQAQVLCEINVSPASLFLGTLQPGEKATRNVVLSSKKPFRIATISGDKKSFEFAAVDGGTAKTMHMVPVTFVAGADRGKVVKDIHISTDLHGAAIDLSTYAIVTE
jgi:hypothetical protein